MKTWRLLLAGDSDDKSQKISEALRRDGVCAKIFRVSDEAQFQKALTRSWDAILCEYRATEFHCLEMLRISRKKGIPFVVIAAGLGEDAIREVFESGASDYVSESEFARLVPSIRKHLKNAEELWRNEEYYKYTALATNDAIWDWDLVTNNLSWSDGFTRLFGFPKEEVEPVVDYWLRHLHPDDHLRVTESLYDAVKQNADFWQEEYRFFRKDGSVANVIDKGFIIRDAAGNAVRMAGGMSDITGQKEMQNALARSNHALQLLGACNAAVARARIESELLEKICQSAVDSGGYRIAWVGYQCNDGGLEIAAYAGERTGTARADRLSDDGIAGECLRSGKPAHCEDIARDKAFSRWMNKGKKSDALSGICLPLSNNGRILGVLGLHSGDTTLPGEREISLLQELAGNLAFGIDHIRSEKERLRLESAVLKMAASVSSGAGVEFFEQLARNMAETLQASATLVVRFFPERPNIAGSLAVFVEGRLAGKFEGVIQDLPDDFFSWNQQPFSEDKLGIFISRGDHVIPKNINAGIGCRLINSAEKPIGLLCALFCEPTIPNDFIRSALRIFATRAAAELERKDADARIREQASLLDKAKDAIMVRNLEQRVIYWNKSAELLYGWSAEEAVGSLITDLIYHETHSFEAANKSLFEHGEWDGEFQHYTKNGDRLFVDIRWNLVHDESGKPVSIFAINTDITAQKKMEEQFLRAQRMESIGTLASGIAHDLNNVLTPITMSINLLKERATDAHDLELLEIIEGSARHGAQMVSQVLTFSRGLQGEKVQVQVSYLIDDLRKIVRDTFPKNIQLQIQTNADLWCILGDPTHLQQVLLNFCVNARDAMPEGGVITITAKNKTDDDLSEDLGSGKYIVISIEDTGAGMSPHVLAQIFDPFFTTKEIGKGTGLGLSTSLAIIKSHKGFIRSYSEEGAGTCFHIYLPAYQGNAARGEQRPSSVVQRGNGETVLVVDDEASIRQIAKRTLEIYGYKVLLAADGVEALDLYKKNKVDVVITDMMMPNMDGQSTIQALARENKNVRVIAASGIAANAQIAKESSSNVKDFLSKPYQAETLLGVLKRVLDG